ncbi:MAG: DUF4493 domain-containing protein [Alistipes sp.]|nr:DUF4493 domain-containing protein [Alistipes sp.]
MKNIVKVLSLVMVVALGLGSCNKDKVDYSTGTNGTDMENKGYLVLGGMDVSVLEDTENIDSTTRGEGVDINNFDVVITNAAGEAVMSFKYGERPTEPIALDGGIYKLTIVSDTMVGAEWERPVYGAESEVIITRKQRTEVNDIVCKLRNIKVSVSYAADIKAQLDPEYTTMTIALEGNSLEYGINEERGGYFAPKAEENTLQLTFKCRYVDGDKDIVMTNEISGVKAAQWRKINVVVQHAADGTTNIGINCDTWTYDEEILFDTAAYLFEEVLVDDTDMPVINFEGHDMEQPFELTDEMFDADGNFKKNINVDVTAKAPIKSIVVKASSDNAEFTAAYDDVMPLECDICDGTVSNTFLKLMGYPTDAKGALATRLKFGAQADMLRTYEGTHSFEIMVEDENGGKTTATLTVKYGQNVAPSIVWVGYDIDKRQTYVSGMTCDLVVKSALTIADFRVKIISNTLTPEELSSVGLAAEFSLVNDTEYFESLGGLGFPTGDAVYGKSEVNLSITNFLSILSMLGAGDHDFEMSVTDMEGNVTTKTVMFRFN